MTKENTLPGCWSKNYSDRKTWIYLIPDIIRYWIRRSYVGCVSLLYEGCILFSKWIRAQTDVCQNSSSILAILVIKWDNQNSSFCRENRLNFFVTWPLSICYQSTHTGITTLFYSARVWMYYVNPSKGSEMHGASSRAFCVGTDYFM